MRGLPRFKTVLFLGVIALAALGAGLAVGTWQTFCYDCPSIAQIYVWEPKQATKIFDREGRLIAELAEQARTPVSIDELPGYVPQAFIAVEDKRFYRHNGLDFIGIARAAVNNIIHMEITGGGSTITQQLARNMFEDRIGFEQVFKRKLKEAKVALELERAYTKDQILEAYINQVNYSCSAWYGIETAAQRYFGKRAAELNPAEAAMLAAVVNLPCVYSPFRNPDRARRRRNLVLELMAQQGYLTREEAEKWKKEPLPEPGEDDDAGDIAPYFVEWVRGLLDDRYGAALYSEGLRIYTTLDLELQRRAREAMERGWKRIETVPDYDHPTYAEVMEDGGSRGRSQTPYVQGMFLALDPRTGEVLALIGGRDFGDSKFNRATQARRQPGSVFKPFVYTAAVASGIPASYVIDDSPLMLEQPDGTMWSPSNYGETFNGPTTLREALRRSINVVAVKLGQEVGLGTVAQYARRMGIATPIPRVPATAIGAADVIPLQVAGAYTTFANGGVRVEPRPIARVEDAEGRVLWESQPEKQRVLEPLVTYVVRDMMRDVVDHGTAYNAVRNFGKIPPEIPAAGKTGTTNDYTDVWFVGYTPNLLAAVWFGFDRPQTILPRATGGGYAAPVWADFARSVYLEPDSLRPVPTEESWPRPAELTSRRVDGESGKLATEWCPLEQVYEEIYLPGTEPTEACDLHGPGLFGAPLRGFVPPNTATADTLADSTRIGGPVR